MNTKSESYPLRRREVAKALLADRDNLIVVGGLGSCAWDITDAGDHDLNFPLWGAMGGAASIGLGLALAKPEYRVLVLTGDGEMLMGMGTLATIALQKPRNLAVVVFDNERYGETGMQETHTQFGVNLEMVAVGAGFRETDTVWTMKELEGSLPLFFETPGPVFLNVKVTDAPQPMNLPMRDGPALKHRFRESLLGQA